MINKNDLRIGNLLANRDLTCHVKAVGETMMELGYFTDSVGFLREYDDEDITPIPITEDWLINFGFYLNKEGYWTHSIDSIFPRYINHGKEWHVHIGNYPVGIFYIHQLQNLFYSLIGKELEILT